MTSIWFSYGRTKDSTNAALFTHPSLWNRAPKYNKSEFIGSRLKKIRKSLFIKVLNSFGVNHVPRRWD